jgi:hypothetical protein
MQKACTAECAISYAVAKRDAKRAKAERIQQAADRKVIKLRKEKLKTKSDYAKEAQTAFNAYIRWRDRDEPCISCGRFHQGQWHAGHYRTVASHPELRYSELNVHKQCAPCNNHKSGDIVNYRINLVQRIGADKVEWLEGPHEPQKLDIEAIKQIKAHYRALVRDLKARAGHG